MSDKKTWSCSACVILIGILISPVIVVYLFSAPRSGYVPIGTGVAIYLPSQNPNAKRISVTVPIENLKEQVPKVFADEEQVEGIAVVWSYEFQTSTPLLGKKTVKTFHKAHTIPLSELHDSINRRGLTIPIHSEMFSLTSDGEDINIVPIEWRNFDPRGLHIERIGYFTRLYGKATVYIGTYHAESEFSSTINTDPLPEEYERQFVYSSLRGIVLPNFGR
ncbi:MAG: hypothetical protein FWE95_02025 [Planctomycetaceae bacterium]|nr:hypothetical protein [Planctomycetaceae bacterium]